MNNIKKEENKQTILNLVNKLQSTLKEEFELELSTEELVEILQIDEEDYEDGKFFELTFAYLNEEFEKDNFFELADDISALKYRESFYNL